MTFSKYCQCESPYIYVISSAALLTSCSSTKYVPEGKYLIDKVNVRTDARYNDINRSRMKSYVRQQGNSRWFSTLKIPLATYSLSGRDSTKWLNRILKDMGESPVLYDSLHTVQSARDLVAELRNEGYLGAYVDISTRIKKKKIDVTYTLHPGEAYSIGNIRYDIQDSAIASLLRMDDVRNQKLKTGQKFNVESLDRERKRITDLIVNNGYYKFNKDFITYNADTVAGNKGIDLTLTLHRYRTNQIADTSHVRYTIRNVDFVSGSQDDPTIHLRRGVL